MHIVKTANDIPMENLTSRIKYWTIHTYTELHEPVERTKNGRTK